MDSRLRLISMNSNKICDFGQVIETFYNFKMERIRIIKLINTFEAFGIVPGRKCVKYTHLFFYISYR